MTCTRWRDVGLDKALQSEYDFVCLPEREMTVVRKEEKRERTEKNQQYHQSVSSSFHAQNHTESARSPSLSLLSRSLFFSSLSLPLFLFSLAPSFSLSLPLSLISPPSLSSPPFSSSLRTSCMCTALSIGSPGWQPASKLGARLAFRCPRGTFADTSGGATARADGLLLLLALQQQHRRDEKSWEQRTIHNHQHHLPRAWRRSPAGRRATQCPSTSS